MSITVNVFKETEENKNNDGYVTRILTTTYGSYHVHICTRFTQRPHMKTISNSTD